MVLTRNVLNSNLNVLNYQMDKDCTVYFIIYKSILKFELPSSSCVDFAQSKEKLPQM